MASLAYCRNRSASFMSSRRSFGVAWSVGDASVAKEVLQASGVHAPPSQGVAGAVSKHVDMHREWQLRSLARSLNHAPNAHATEWMASLIHENIGRLDSIERVAALKRL
jgi:hypothetical protein